MIYYTQTATFTIRKTHHSKLPCAMQNVVTKHTLCSVRQLVSFYIFTIKSTQTYVIKATAIGLQVRNAGREIRPRGPQPGG